MLDDIKSFRRFEQWLFLFRWIVIFIATFSLDQSVYSNLPLFRSLSYVLVVIGFWNIVLYIITQKSYRVYEQRKVWGLIEVAVDLCLLAWAVDALDVYGSSFTYIFHFLFSLIIYVRYVLQPITWFVQAAIILHIIYIQYNSLSHYYPLKEVNFEITIVGIFFLGGLSYLWGKRQLDLQELVHKQEDQVNYLNRHIKRMETLSQMSQIIFESNSKSVILINLLENIHKVTGEDGIAIFLYGENGVESDAKLYHFKDIREYYASGELIHTSVYNQKDVEEMRKKREYRYCILNHEPIIIANSPYEKLFYELIGRELKPFIYLFNIVNNEENVGTVICNMGKREDVNICEHIAKIVEHTGIALFKDALIEKERNKSTYDTLTKVHSRESINKIFPLLIRQSSEELNKLGVFFIDIDYFKGVNDTYGHHIGDAVLREVAHTLKQHVPEGSLVGRYGGEEFLVVIKEEEATEIVSIAEKIRLEVAKINFDSLMDRKKYITISLGISLYPDHGDQVDQLIKNADSAMYKAKRIKNTVCLFENTLLKEE